MIKHIKLDTIHHQIHPSANLKTTFISAVLISSLVVPSAKFAFPAFVSELMAIIARLPLAYGFNFKPHRTWCYAVVYIGTSILDASLIKLHKTHTPKIKARIVAIIRCYIHMYRRTYQSATRSQLRVIALDDAFITILGRFFSHVQLHLLLSQIDSHHRSL